MNPKIHKSKFPFKLEYWKTTNIVYKTREQKKKKTSNVTNGMSSLTFIYTSQVKKTKPKQILINEFEKGKQVQNYNLFWYSENFASMQPSLRQLKDQKDE